MYASKSGSQGGNSAGEDPLGQMTDENKRTLRFSREKDPPPPIHLAGGGGCQDGKILDFRAVLAFRQLPWLGAVPQRTIFGLPIRYLLPAIKPARAGSKDRNSVSGTY